MFSSVPLGSRTTRGQQPGNLVIPVSKRMSGSNSLSVRLSLLWNALPNDLKSSSSLPIFRKAFQDLLSDPQAVHRFSSLVFDSFMQSVFHAAHRSFLSVLSSLSVSLSLSVCLSVCLSVSLSLSLSLCPLIRVS